MNYSQSNVRPASRSSTRSKPLLLVIMLYLVVALAYGVVNPLFEAPDEHWHYFTAQYIAENRRLPRVEDPPDPWLGQEAGQPPLYYILAAVLIAPLDTSDARETVWPNPRVEVGDASAANNLNAFVHGPWEAWPWQGYALAAHMLRAFSSLLGLGTLFFIYRAALERWPAHPRRALLAMAMTAFLPQFLFIHSAVTNDALITMLSAAALWRLLRLWRNGFQKHTMTLLGVTIGLAILSKTAGLLLLAFSCAVLLLWTMRQGHHRERAVLQIVVLVALPALLIGSPLLWRNWSLYGDPTAANQFVAIAGGDRDYSLLDVLGESGGLWTSFFAMFGWFNVRAPDWVYWLWNAMALLATAGALWATFSPRQRAYIGNGRSDGNGQGDRRLVVLWLALWVLLVYAGLVAFMLRTPAAQGRLLFPALLPLALAMAYGLDQFGRLRFLWPSLALLTTLVGLLSVIPDTYEQPRRLPSARLPADVTPAQVQFEEGAILLGYRPGTSQLQPGDTLKMELFWLRGAEDGGRNDAPQLVVELFGRDEALVGKFQGYHGRGLFPVTLWPRDTIIVEQVTVPLTDTMSAPAGVRLQVGLTSSAQRETLTTLDVEPADWPVVPEAELARLGGEISLLQATLSPPQISAGDMLTVTLSWHVRQDIQSAYTTFVHLGEPDETPLAQADGPPLNGYYATTLWEAGEVMSGDVYLLQAPLALSPGRYPLWIGLYESQSGQRLPLSVNGERQLHDAFLVGWVIVN